MIAVTSFEATKSVFNITNERIVFQRLYQAIGHHEGAQKQLLF